MLNDSVAVLQASMFDCLFFDPSTRCKYHSGMSRGPKSIEGRIKSLSKLRQYQNRTDLLHARARIEKLRQEAAACWYI